MKYDFILPTSLMLPRKTKADRKVQLNLNSYRNRHYTMSNNIKKVFCEKMKEQMQWKKFDTPIEFEFHIRSKRIGFDWDNKDSVIRKFFFDALTHYECIPDDNVDYITWSKWLFKWRCDEDYVWVLVKKGKPYNNNKTKAPIAVKNALAIMK